MTTPLTINIAVQTPLLNGIYYPAIQNICQQYADLVCKDYGIAQFNVLLTNQKDTSAFSNVFVTDIIPNLGANTLGYHNPPDVNGQVVAYVSAHRTLLRVGSPFGQIVKGRPAVNNRFLKRPATPDTYVSGSFMQVLTHEIAELIVDPNCNTQVPRPSKNQLWLKEVCDPAHEFLFPITYTDPKTKGVFTGICADYVLPSFWVEKSLAPYSHTGKVPLYFCLATTTDYATIVDATTKVSIKVAGATNDNM